jgi:hypothetical protein
MAGSTFDGDGAAAQEFLSDHHANRRFNAFPPGQLGVRTDGDDYDGEEFESRAS